MGANRLLVARAAASFILAISSGVAAQEPGDDWAISDTSDNVRGTRHVGALTLATGGDRAGQPSLHLGCGEGVKPELFLLFDLEKVPAEETAVRLSFLKHRATLNYPVSLWKSDALARLIYDGDLDQFASDAGESFVVEVVITSERGRAVYAYGMGGFGKALGYLRRNCGKSSG